MKKIRRLCTWPGQDSVPKMHTLYEYHGKFYVLETGNIVLSGDAKELMNNERVKKAYLSE